MGFWELETTQLQLQSPIQESTNTCARQWMLHQSGSIVVSNKVISAVAVLGILGNLFNMIVLTKLRRVPHRPTKGLSRQISVTQGGMAVTASNNGLLALAVSDLLFCVSVLPSSMMPPGLVFSDTSVLFYYSVYHYGLINMFITSSTLFTVAMALERYLACCQPLHPTLYLDSKRVKYIVCVIVVFSFILNIPAFWRRRQRKCSIEDFSDISISDNSSDINLPLETNGISLVDVTPLVILNTLNFQSRNVSKSVNHAQSVSSTQFNRTTNSGILLDITLPDGSNSSSYFYTSDSGLFSDSEYVEHIYRVLWAAFLNVLPVLFLCFFNINLIWSVRNSRRFRGRFLRNNPANQPVTHSLIAIIVMFLVLVAPSELGLVIARHFHGDNSPSFLLTEAVFNITQTINFSIHFLLYIIISPHFRRVLLRCLASKTRNETRNESISLSSN